VPDDAMPDQSSTEKQAVPAQEPPPARPRRAALPAPAPVARRRPAKATPVPGGSEVPPPSSSSIASKLQELEARLAVTPLEASRRTDVPAGPASRKAAAVAPVVEAPAEAPAADVPAPAEESPAPVEVPAPIEVPAPVEVPAPIEAATAVPGPRKAAARRKASVPETQSVGLPADHSAKAPAALEEMATTEPDAAAAPASLPRVRKAAAQQDSAQVPAAKRPAKKAVAALIELPVEAAAQATPEVAPDAAAPAKRAPRASSARTTTVLGPSPTPPPVPDPAAGEAIPAQRRGGLPFGALLVVLLLAVAAGLGVAALVLNRAATFEARTVVQVVPVGSAGSADALKAAVVKYERQVAARDLTGDASASVGVRRSQVSEAIRARTAGTDKIELVVRAKSAGDADAVAQAAGGALVELVVVDQIDSAPALEDTVTASVVSGADAERATPTHTDAALVGGGTAAGVLVLAGIGAALARKNRQKV
jgi:hypothetical protein